MWRRLIFSDLGGQTFGRKHRSIHRHKWDDMRRPHGRQGRAIGRNAGVGEIAVAVPPGAAPSPSHAVLKATRPSVRPQAGVIESSHHGWTILSAPHPIRPVFCLRGHAVALLAARPPLGLRWASTSRGGQSRQRGQRLRETGRFRSCRRRADGQGQRGHGTLLFSRSPAIFPSIPFHASRSFPPQ